MSPENDERPISNVPNEPPRTFSPNPQPTSSFGSERPVGHAPTTPHIPSFGQPEGDLPMPQNEDAPFQPFTPKPKNSRKKLITAIVLAIIVVLGAGVYAAYALWYNKPDKVISDAFRSAISARSAKYEGKIEYTPANSGTGSITVDFDGQGDQENSQVNMKMNVNMAPFNLNLGTSLLSTKSGDLYFKIDNAKGILNTYASFLGQSAETNPTLKTISDKVDNKWVKVTAADLKELNSQGDDEQTVCLQKAVADFQNNKSQQDQVYKAFNDNRFINVDKHLGAATIGGVVSQGYELGFDQNKAKSFIGAAEQADIVKAISKCVGEDSSTDDSEADTSSADAPNPKVEVWADQWTHELTRVKIVMDDTTSGKLSFTFDPKLNLPVNVTAPTDGVTEFKDLMKDFEALFGSAEALLPSSDFESDLLESEVPALQS